MIPMPSPESACTPRPAGEASLRANANTEALRPDAAAMAAARRVLAESAGCSAPVADARLLPNAAYNDADFWRFERHALFEREWLFVGHVSQVPQPGDHLAVRILDEPLLIVRDQDGTLRVLSAICQHRGHPLMEGLAAPADPTRCSNAKLLVCPYHSWSYKLDGRLHSAPAMGRTTPIVTLREDVRLPVIRSEIVHGLIFVNFADDAPPLAPRLAKFDAAVRNFDVANLVATPTVTTGPHRWNWKIYQENSLEPYHTDYVHRDSHNPAPANLSAFYPFDEGDGQIITTTGFSGESGELFDAEGKVQLPAIEGLTHEEQGRLLFISVMPILFMVLEAGSVLVTMALPLDADRTELRMFSLHPKAATEVDGFADIQAAQLQQLLAIVGEDLTTQEALHRGHRSRFSPPGRLSWLEATLPQMNQWLLERYRAAYAALTEPGTAARSVTAGDLSMSVTPLHFTPPADHRAALDRPLGYAEGLPGDCYGADYYRREQRTVFVNRWNAVAVGAQLPNVGDALPVDLAGWQLLLVRGEDGKIAAFHNVCRHRAMKLVAEPCSGLKSLRCPWHSWRYALDGQLLATPEVGGDRIGEADGFDRAELSLKPVAVGRWLDYVFVNIDGQAPPFEQHIAPLAALLGNVVLDDLHHIGSFEHRYAGNWKIVTESGIEDYHLPFGHPQLNARLLRNSAPVISEPVYCGVATDLGALPAEADTRAWNAQLADVPRRDPSLPRELYAMNVFPTGGMLLAADQLMLGIHLPDGPAHTRVLINVYAHGETATSVENADARKAVFDMWHEVLGQDAAFIEGVQANASTRDALGIRTRFSPYWEAAVHSFQRMVAAAVG